MLSVTPQQNLRELADTQLLLSAVDVGLGGVRGKTLTGVLSEVLCGVVTKVGKTFLMSCIFINLL